MLFQLNLAGRFCNIRKRNNDKNIDKSDKNIDKSDKNMDISDKNIDKSCYNVPTNTIFPY